MLFGSAHRTGHFIVRLFLNLKAAAATEEAFIPLPHLLFVSVNLLKIMYLKCTPESLKYGRIMEHINRYTDETLKRQK